MNLKKIKISNKKKISIIITAFNSSGTIKKCIQSVCNQSNNRVEVIVINDNSIDNTNQIILKLGKKYLFKYINLKKNLGIGKVRNYSLKIAKGEFIWFIDSDDQVLKTSISLILKKILSKKNTDLLFLSFIRLTNKKIKHSISEEIKNLSLFFAPWRFILNKNFLKENKLSFLNSRTHEDILFLIKSIIFSKNTVNLEKPCYIWNNNNSNSLGRDLNSKSVKTLSKIFFEAKKLINELEKKNIKIKNFKIKLIDNFLKKLKFKIFLYSLILSMKEINSLKMKMGPQNKLQLAYFHKNFKKRIKELKKKISNFEIIIFCASTFSRLIIRKLKTYKIRIKFIFDNNTNYTSQFFEGLEIRNFENENNIDAMYKILVCCESKNSGQLIFNQLRQKSVQKDRIIIINSKNL